MRWQSSYNALILALTMFCSSVSAARVYLCNQTSPNATAPTWSTAEGNELFGVNCRVPSGVLFSILDDIPAGSNVTVEMTGGSVAGGAPSGLFISTPSASAALGMSPFNILVTNVLFETGAILFVSGSLSPSSSLTLSNNSFTVTDADSNNAAIFITMADISGLFLLSKQSMVAIVGNDVTAQGTQSRHIAHTNISVRLFVTEGSTLKIASNRLFGSSGGNLTLLDLTSLGTNHHVEGQSTVVISDNAITDTTLTSLNAFLMHCQTGWSISGTSSLVLEDNWLSNISTQQASLLVFQFSGMTDFFQLFDGSSAMISNNSVNNVATRGGGRVFVLWLLSFGALDITVSEQSEMLITDNFLKNVSGDVITVVWEASIANIHINNGSALSLDNNGVLYSATDATKLAAVLWSTKGNLSIQCFDFSQLQFQNNSISNSDGSLSQDVSAVSLVSKGALLLSVTSHSNFSAGENRIHGTPSASALCVGFSSNSSAIYVANRSLLTLISNKISDVVAETINVIRIGSNTLGILVSTGSQFVMAANAALNIQSTRDMYSISLISAASLSINLNHSSILVFQNNGIYSSLCVNIVALYITSVGDNSIVADDGGSLTMSNNSIADVKATSAKVVFVFSDQNSRILLFNASAMVVKYNYLQVNVNSEFAYVFLWQATVASELSVMCRSFVSIEDNLIQNTSSPQFMYTVYWLSPGSITLLATDNSSIRMNSNRAIASASTLRLRAVCIISISQNTVVTVSNRSYLSLSLNEVKHGSSGTVAAVHCEATSTLLKFEIGANSTTKFDDNLIANVTIELSDVVTTVNLKSNAGSVAVAGASRLSICNNRLLDSNSSSSASAVSLRHTGNCQWMLSTLAYMRLENNTVEAVGGLQTVSAILLIGQYFDVSLSYGSRLCINGNGIGPLIARIAIVVNWQASPVLALSFGSALSLDNNSLIGIISTSAMTCVRFTQTSLVLTTASTVFFRGNTVVDSVGLTVAALELSLDDNNVNIKIDGISRMAIENNSIRNCTSGNEMFVVLFFQDQNVLDLAVTNYSVACVSNNSILDSSALSISHAVYGSSASPLSRINIASGSQIAMHANIVRNATAGMDLSAVWVNMSRGTLIINGNSTFSLSRTAVELAAAPNLTVVTFSFGVIFMKRASMTVTETVVRSASLSTVLAFSISVLDVTSQSSFVVSRGSIAAIGGLVAVMNLLVSQTRFSGSSSLQITTNDALGSLVQPSFSILVVGELLNRDISSEQSNVSITDSSNMLISRNTVTDGAILVIAVPIHLAGGASVVVDSNQATLRTGTKSPLLFIEPIYLTGENESISIIQNNISIELLLSHADPTVCPPPALTLFVTSAALPLGNISSLSIVKNTFEQKAANLSSLANDPCPCLFLSIFLVDHTEIIQNSFNCDAQTQVVFEKLVGKSSMYLWQNHFKLGKIDNITIFDVRNLSLAGNSNLSIWMNSANVSDAIMGTKRITLYNVTGHVEIEDSPFLLSCYNTVYDEGTQEPYSIDARIFPSAVSERATHCDSPTHAPISPILAVVKVAQKVKEVTSIVVTVTAVASVAGGQLGVANAIVRMADCEDPGDIDGGSLDILVHPLQFSFGDRAYQRYSAGAISDTLLVPLIVTAIALGPVRLMLMHTRSIPSHVAMAQMGWPSLLVLPFANLAEGIGMTTMTSLLSGETFGIGMGIIALAVLIAFFASWLWILARVVPRGRQVLRVENAVDEQGKQRLFVLRILRPSHRWVPREAEGPSTLNPVFVEKYNNTVGDKYWYYAELASFVCSVVVGVAESLPSSVCRERAAIAVVIALSQCVLSLVALVPIERVLQSLLALCLVPLYIVVMVKVFSDDQNDNDGEDGLDTAIAVLSTASNMIGIALMSIGLLVGLREVIHILRATPKRKRVKSTNSNESSNVYPFDSATPLVLPMAEVPSFQPLLYAREAENDVEEEREVEEERVPHKMRQRSERVERTVDEVLDYVEEVAIQGRLLTL